MHHLPPDCTPVICTPAADSEKLLCQPVPDDQNTWILVPMDDGTIAWCKTSLRNDDDRD